MIRLPEVLRAVRVARITDLSPNLRRLVCTGPELAEFSHADHVYPAFASPSFDDHVQLLPMTAAERAEHRPRLASGRVAWTPLARSKTRSYTVRSFADGELALDVVNHPGGLAASWAYNCQVGDEIDFVGPATSQPIPEGFDWQLLAGDETALPALCRWVDEAPPGVRAQVFAEVPTAADQLELELPDGITWTWLPRESAAPNELLVAAVLASDWWPGSCHAFIAGESAAIGPIRTYLRQSRELPRAATRVIGYWRAASLRQPRPATSTRS